MDFSSNSEGGHAGQLRQTIEPVIRGHLSRLIDDIVRITQVRSGAPPDNAGNAGTPSQDLASTIRSSNPSPLGVEYIHGLESINEQIAAAVNSARSEILTAQPGGPRPEAVLAAALNTVRERIAAGVRMRTLYQHSTRFDEPTKNYARAVIKLGAELRTLDEFFERLVIIDQATAFLPAAADRRTAIRVTEPALVRFLRDLFDRTWERAAAFPFRPNRAKDAASEIMPEIRQAIRRLLIEGHADKTIGRRLGISERTISTHVAWLRDSVGAANRLQLGYRLAEEDLRPSAPAAGEAGPRVSP